MFQASAKEPEKTEYIKITYTAANTSLYQAHQLRMIHRLPVASELCKIIKLNADLIETII